MEADDLRWWPQKVSAKKEKYICVHLLVGEMDCWSSSLRVLNCLLNSTRKEKDKINIFIVTYYHSLISYGFNQQGELCAWTSHWFGWSIRQIRTSIHLCSLTHFLLCTCILVTMGDCGSMGGRRWKGGKVRTREIKSRGRLWKRWMVSYGMRWRCPGGNKSQFALIFFLQRLTNRQRR